MSALRIGVIGGGASAVCLLDALAQQENLRGGQLTVFEPTPRLWRGRAYQPDVDAVRVNAPPADMSVRAGATDHFREWLCAKGFRPDASSPYWDSRAGTVFVPRAVYGDYLEESAMAACSRLMERGWHVELVRDRVEHALSTHNGLVLMATNGYRVHVDHAILCVGANRPADVYTLSGSDRFIREPYPLERTVNAIPADATVGVLGSGLTGIDVVRTLTSRGHRGQISLLSRHGVLPSVRQRVTHHWLRHFTPERFRAAASRGEHTTLAMVTEVMAKELVAAGESPDTIRAEITAVRREAPVARLRRQLASVSSSAMGLRILQQAVPEAGPDVWPLLSGVEQENLLEQHERVVMSLCCPMSPGSAATLLDLIRGGQLEIAPGLRGVDVRPDGRFTVDAPGKQRTVDYIVNAVNSRLRGLPVQANSLLASLVRAGLAEPHPRGGLRVERSTSRLLADGRPMRGLYALGDLAGGSLFFTFGIQSLVDRAADIVDTIDAGDPADRLDPVFIPQPRSGAAPQLALH
jgi:uncharacterized NAD(P)/FAD-binding protein YdhS